jgi:plastocyanin
MNRKERQTNYVIVYGIVISAIFVASLLLLASDINSQFQPTKEVLAVNNIDNATGGGGGKEQREATATNQTTTTTGSNDTTGAMTNQTNITTNTTSTITTSKNKVSIVEDGSEMGDNAFDPNPINIKVGDTVTWINDDVATHTVTSDSGSDEDNDTKSTNGETFDSGYLSQGQTFEHTFKKAGNYGYFCTLHPSMTGEVEVKKG